MMQVLTTRTVKIYINQLSIANISNDMLSTRVDYAIPHIPNCAMLSTIADDVSPHNPQSETINKSAFSG